MAGNVSQRVVCSPPESKYHQSNPRTTETGTMRGEITLTTTHINTHVLNQIQPTAYFCKSSFIGTQPPSVYRCFCAKMAEMWQKLYGL